MTTLKPDRAGFHALLSTWQKARSIAAEGGYANLAKDFARIMGTRDPEWVIFDDRTGEMLADLVSGKKICDPTLWLNLSIMVDRSKLWAVGLAFNGWEMPEPQEAMAMFRSAECCHKCDSLAVERCTVDDLLGNKCVTYRCADHTCNCLRGIRTTLGSEEGA